MLRYFKTDGKKVVTFEGYSGSGYEHPDQVLEVARKILSSFDPNKTVINIGGTPEGIGAVYELAKSMGFETTEIESTQGKGAATSSYVSRIFYIADSMWGGVDPKTHHLSATSESIISASDEIYAMGGGPVAPTKSKQQ